MRTLPLHSSSRIACGVLLSAALVACEGAEPVGIESTSLSNAISIAACTAVELDAVYSGPPNQANFVIDLSDPWVYVEVLDISQYSLPPSPPSADDVRIGDDFATGTGAESFEIVDINSDGKLDVRLRFSKFELVDDGNLTDDAVQTIQVWGLDRGPDKEYCGSEEVTVTTVPPEPGEDVVVFNDVNPFDNTAMAGSTDNEMMVKNLVSFSTPGKPRDDGTVVWWDYGRSSGCAGCVSLSTTMGLIASEGFTLTVITSSAGTLTSIPASVKSIWLWLPKVAYTVAEINALKAFAAEGGRIVFIGEWDGFYGSTGLAVENAFLDDMGATMVNTGGAVDCGFTYLPGTSIEAHQVTTGVDDLTIACASVIEPGPGDFILYYNTGGTMVLAGVAKIDTTPISMTALRAPLPPISARAKLPRGVKNTPTGR